MNGLGQGPGQPSTDAPYAAKPTMQQPLHPCLNWNATTLLPLGVKEALAAARPSTFPMGASFNGRSLTTATASGSTWKQAAVSGRVFAVLLTPTTQGGGSSTYFVCEAAPIPVVLIQSPRPVGRRAMRRPATGHSGNPAGNLIQEGASPAVGTAEGAGWGIALGGLLGALVGHLASSEHAWRDAGIGAAVGGLGLGVAAYFAARNNVNLTVSAGGQYTVSLTSAETLFITAPSGATASVGATGASGAQYVVNKNTSPPTSGGLASGANTINVSWTDASGASQTATVVATVS